MPNGGVVFPSSNTTTPQHTLINPASWRGRPNAGVQCSSPSTMHLQSISRHKKAI